MSKDPSLINAVVVGFGLAGRAFHCYLIGLVPEINLYGVVSSRDETQQEIEKIGSRRFAHINDVLSDEQVDLVVLATPNDLHAPQALAALSAGKHVVTDKPMCLNAVQAKTMIAAAQSNNKILSVFQNRRWDWDFLTIQKAVKEGLVGNLVSLELSWNHPGKPRTWRSAAEHGGGRWLDLGAHMVDQSLQLVSSEVDRVYAQFFYQAIENNVEDHAHCLLTFANGTLAHITASSVARLPKRRWFVVGTQGTLIKRGFDPQENAMKAGNIHLAKEHPRDYAQIYYERNGKQEQLTVDPVPGRWISYYENIADAILGKDKLIVSAESVHKVMRVLDAAAESATHGKSITLT